MNITIVSNVTGYRWAGSEELWLATGLRALRDGHRLTALLSSDIAKGSPVQGLRQAGATVRTWRRWLPHRLERFRQFLHPTFSHHRLGNPDIILLSLGSLPGLCYVPGLAQFLTRTRIPFAVLCQFNAECLSFSSSERSSISQILSRAACNVFVSEQNRELAARQFAVPLHNTYVIYNPIRTRLESPLPWPNQHIPVLTCVARLETLWKGQDLLIQLLSSLRWRSREWRLQLFGEGPDTGFVKSLAERLGISDRIAFRGYDRDIRSLWADSHLMVLPSRGEGNALAILEAMMCGRPVVTTDVGANCEVLKDEVSGFIADAATPRSFGSALERAWSSRERWQQMGLNAYERARELACRDPAGELLTVLQKYYTS